MTVKEHGPFSTPKYKFDIDGYKVPHIEGVLIDGENTWNIILDGRFGITASDQEVKRWLPILANAMAIAGGFTCHGEHSKTINPHTTQIMRINNETPEGDIE